MKVFKVPICLVAVALVLGAVSVPAGADVTYKFTHIIEPGDGPDELGNGAIGEAQLFVDVAPYGSDQVLFTFRNTGPEPSSITDAYYDNGPLLFLAGLIDADDGIGGDSGVDFSELADPDELPGGNLLSPPFVTTDGFSADSDPPIRPNGVDPTESLGIIFDLYENMDFTDVIYDLDLNFLRVGIKVGGFAGGGSESFVNNGRDVPCALTTSSTAGGSVTEPGEGKFPYDCGTAVPVCATPDTCYHFVNWTGTAVDANKVADAYAVCTTVTVDANYTLEANFAINQHTVTPSAGQGGSIKPSAPVDANCNDYLTFMATPDCGYEVDTWYVDGNPDQTGGTSYTLHVTANHQIHVTFEKEVHDIPTVSEWGLIIMVLLLLTAGAIVIKWRRRWAAA